MTSGYRLVDGAEARDGVAWRHADPGRTLVPRLVRLALGLFRVADFLVVTIATAPAEPSGQTATAAR